MIESEQCYVFTNDVEYMTKRTNIIPVIFSSKFCAYIVLNFQQGNQGPNQQQIDPQKLFIKEMRDRIDSYFEIVVRNTRDSVPKVIGFFLVKAIQEKMQFALHTELNKSETIMALLGEVSLSFQIDSAINLIFLSSLHTLPPKEKHWLKYLKFLEKQRKSSPRIQSTKLFVAT